MASEEMGHPARGPGEAEPPQGAGYGPELAALDLLMETTSAGLDLPTILDRVVEAAQTLLGLPVAAVLLWDERRRTLHLTAARGMDANWLPTGGHIPEADLTSWFCGRVFLEQKPVFIQDRQFAGAYADTWAVAYGAVALAAAPLMARERPLGVLLLGGPSPRSFSPVDARLLQTIARQLAIAIDNARAYAQAEQRAELLRVLLGTLQELNSTLDLRQLLEVIAHQSRALIEVDRCVIFLLNPDTGVLTPVVAEHARAEQVLGLTLQLGQGITGHVAMTGIAEVVNHAEQDPRTFNLPGTPVLPEALLVAPLCYKGRVLGVMTLGRLGERGFVPEDLDLLNSFASQAAIAVENARLYTESRQRARQLEQAHARLVAAQNQLVQAEKLSAIGQLAAGMAHELNNPLTAIKGFAQLLEAEGLGASGRPDLRRILGAVDRAQRIVGNLLSFARPQRPSPQAVDLAALVERTVQLHSQEQPAAITVRTELDRALPKVSLDPLQIEQLIVHLLRNAHRATRQAGGGTLTVRLRQAGRDQVRLEVVDQGPGIPADILPHIFDPFFTTSEEAQGLGLSACFGIVRAHGGRIWAEPVLEGRPRVVAGEGPAAPEGGTRLVVELPVGSLLAPAQPAQPQERAILVVSDDDAHAGALATTVEEMGHRATCVESAEAALAEIVVRHYDVVLCDVALPGMGIGTLYNSVCANDSGLARRFLAIGAPEGVPMGVPTILPPGGAARVRQAVAACLGG